MIKSKAFAHELHELTRISQKRETSITTTKGDHGLHKDSFRLQIMTAFYQKFLQGGPDVSRGQFFQKAPPWPPEAR